MTNSGGGNDDETTFGDIEIEPNNVTEGLTKTSKTRTNGNQIKVMLFGRPRDFLYLV